MKQRQYFFILLLTAGILFFSPNQNLYADDVQNINYIERGFTRIFSSVYQLPFYLFQKTFYGPPVVGTVDGVITGAYYTVSNLTGGLFDIARGAVPYGKYMLFMA